MIMVTTTALIFCRFLVYSYLLLLNSPRGYSVKVTKHTVVYLEDFAIYLVEEDGKVEVSKSLGLLTLYFMI